jgi:DNA-binding transcriptional LysR family regulator
LVGEARAGLVLQDAGAARAPVGPILSQGRRMDWDDIKVVLAIHRNGSLTAAARELAVDQSTVGRRLTAFEAELKTRLFDRISGRLSLRMEQEALALENTLRGSDDRVAGEVVVTSVGMLVDAFLIPALDAFRAQYPDIRLAFNVSNENVQLGRREADIALRLGPPEDEHLLAWHVGALAHGIYAHRSLIERRGTDDPARLPWIGYSEKRSTAPEPTWLERTFADAPRAFDVNFTPSRAQGVALGLGIGILPCFMMNGRADVVRLDPADFDIKRDIWLLTLPELKNTPRIRVTLRWLTETMRAAAPALACEPAPKAVEALHRATKRVPA